MCYEWGPGKVHKIGNCPCGRYMWSNCIPYEGETMVVDKYDTRELMFSTRYYCSERIINPIEFYVSILNKGMEVVL
jgi:hypothetical protein